MDREILLAGGFVLRTYPGQVGEFLTKRTKVRDLPRACKHLVDGDFIEDDFEVDTEVIPGNMVQLYIPDADYLEGPFPIGSEEGMALLQDALAAR